MKSFPKSVLTCDEGPSEKKLARQLKIYDVYNSPKLTEKIEKFDKTKVGVGAVGNELDPEEEGFCEINRSSGWRQRRHEHRYCAPSRGNPQSV